MTAETLDGNNQQPDPSTMNDGQRRLAGVGLLSPGNAGEDPQTIRVLMPDGSHEVHEATPVATTLTDGSAATLWVPNDTTAIARALPRPSWII